MWVCLTIRSVELGSCIAGRDEGVGIRRERRVRRKTTAVRGNAGVCVTQFIFRFEPDYDLE